MNSGYAEFTSRGAEILAVGPNDRAAFEAYWAENRIPFVGLPDPDHTVARQYRQEVNLFKFGRMPLNCVVDLEGNIRFVHYGASMSDIPENETFLRVIERLNEPDE